MSIFKFLFDSATDLDAKFRRYGDVATVKKRVYVLPEKDSVVHCVRPLVGVRPYMRRFKNMQNRRACECATPLVRIRDQHTKGPLTKSGQYKLRLAKARPHLSDFRREGIRALVELQSILNLLPNG